MNLYILAVENSTAKTSENIGSCSFSPVHDGDFSQKHWPGSGCPSGALRLAQKNLRTHPDRQGKFHYQDYDHVLGQLYWGLILVLGVAVGGRLKIEQSN